MYALAHRTGDLVRNGPDQAGQLGDRDATLAIPTDQRISVVSETAGRAQQMPQIHLWWTEKSLRKNDAVFDGYNLELVLEPASGTTRKGQIYLCLPDAGKSALAGSFEATLVD